MAQPSPPEKPPAPAEPQPAPPWWLRARTGLVGMSVITILALLAGLWSQLGGTRVAPVQPATPTSTVAQPKVAAQPTRAPVAAATATPQLATGGAPAADAARRTAEAQLVGRPGARLVVDGQVTVLPVQPGESCVHPKTGVGSRHVYNVQMPDGWSLVVDAVTVNEMFDGSNPGVAWKKGPWNGTLDILDGAICAVPTEWFDWAVKHRTDVLASIRTRYGLSPTPPVRELP